MTHNHTPGPWQLTDAGPNSGNIVRGEITGADGAHIADLIDADGQMTPKQWKANAKLIRAAPELLEAMKKIVKELSQDRDHGLKGEPVFYAINIARKAIEVVSQ